MKLSEKNRAEYEALGLPFEWNKPLQIEAQARFCLKAANSHHVLAEENERLREALVCYERLFRELALKPTEHNELYEKAPWWANPNLPPPLITCGTSEEEALKGETK